MCTPRELYDILFYLSFEKTIGSRTNFTGYRYAVKVASFLPPPLPHPFPEIAIATTFLHLFRNNQRSYKCICRQFFFCHKSILNIWSCILVFFFFFPLNSVSWRLLYVSTERWLSIYFNSRIVFHYVNESYSNGSVSL